MATRALPLVMVLLTACASRTAPGANSELPPWITDPLAVRLDLAQKLVDEGNPIALEVIRGLRKDGQVPEAELDYLQGKALRNDGLYPEAERLLLSAAKKLGRDERPYEALCVLFADQQRVEEAILHCKRAVELDDEHAAAWNNYGFLLLTVPRAQEALKALETAVELDGSNSRFRNNLAMALVAGGREKDALRTFMSTGPRADAHYNVAAAIERFGTPADAVFYYDEALKLDPNHRQAKDALARIKAAAASAEGQKEEPP